MLMPIRVLAILRRGVLPTAEAVPGSLNSRVKPFRSKRLEKVVDGVNLKCPQCILIVRSGEYDRRHGDIFFRRKRPHYIESIHARHSNVEKQEHWVGHSYY